MAFGIRITAIKKNKTIRLFESREEEHSYILRDVTKNSVKFDESQKYNEFVCGAFVWEPEGVCSICTCAFKIAHCHSLNTYLFHFPK